ncbi:hypothetical protein KKC32_04940 [Patescibacteria group bacterium]|nr:hypothetical protein [Patescibacteria group bacterium]
MTEQIKSEAQNFESMAVKANLSNVEREYFEKLKAELKQILGGKTLEDIEKTQNLVLARKASGKMARILEFLKSKEINDEEMEERREKEKAYEELLVWARDDFGREDAEEWIEKTFDLDELPIVKVRRTKLDLSGTAVSYLPGKLQVDSLDISETKNLAALPDGIKLKKLDASGSELATLDGVEVTISINICFNNKIKSLPQGTSVEKLQATHSALSTLEGVEVTKFLNIISNRNIESLKKGTKLEQLHAEGRSLSTLEGVEVTKVLNINYNEKIASLPKGTKLEALYAAEGALSTLEGVEIAKILNIKGNKNIKSLPSGINLEELNASNCALEDLPNDLIVSGTLLISGCSETVKQKARELYEKGQIGTLAL